MSEATLGLRVILEDGASSGLGALGLRLGGLYGVSSMLAHAWGKLSPTTKALGVSAAVSGIAFGALAGFLRSSIDAATQLEAEMNKVQITVNGASEAGSALTTSLVHIADTSIYTTAQVADAFSQLGIDGYDATDIMNGLGQATIDFAEAAQTQTVPAALLLGSTMRMFGASADQATSYANDLTFAMYNGQKNASNLQQAIAQVGPIASIAGVQFNELAIAIAYMGQNGYTGTRAGTALRYMIAGLTSPTHAAAEEMKKLGLAVVDAAGNIQSSKFFDAQGNFIGVAKSIDVLNQALQNLNPEQRMIALKNLFSVRGGQGAEVFLKNYSHWLNSFQDLSGIENTTSVVGKAGQVTSTFASAIQRVQTTWNDFKAMLGQADLGPLKAGFNGLANALDRFNTASSSVHTFAGVLLTAATVASGLVFVGTTLGFVSRSFKELSLAAKVFAPIGQGFSNLASPVRNLAAAGASVGESFAKNFIPALRSLPGLLTSLPGLISNGVMGALGSLLSIPTKLLGAWQGIPGIFGLVRTAAMGAIPALAGLAGAILPILAIALAVAGGVAIVVLMFTTFRKQTMQLWNDITGGKNILQQLSAMFSSAFGQIKQVWNQVWPQIQPAMTQLFAALHQMVPLFQVIGVVIGAVIQVILTVLVALITGFMRALGPIIQFFTGIFQVIGGITQLVVAIFTGQWGKIPGILGGILGGLVNIVTAPFKFIWAFVSGFVGSILGVFSGLFNGIGSIFSGLFNLITAPFRQAQTAVENILKMFSGNAIGHIVGMVGGMVANIAGLPGRFISTGINLITGFIGSIVSSIPKIITHMQQMGNDMLRNILSLPGKMISAGNSIIEGLVNGLKNAAGAVINFVKGLVGNIIGSIKGLFGIHSPSTVMHEIGGHISHGLALGIQSVDVSGQAAKHYAGIVSAVPNARAAVSVGTSISSAVAANAAAAAAVGGGNIIVPVNIDGRTVGQVVIDRVTGTLKQNGAGRLFR